MRRSTVVSKYRKGNRLPVGLLFQACRSDVHSFSTHSTIRGGASRRRRFFPNVQVRREWDLRNNKSRMRCLVTLRTKCKLIGLMKTCSKFRNDQETEILTLLSGLYPRRNFTR
ncbi:uncharacterized protein LOC112638496 [Camponotus floridanus]|nr:uncharacterized protein LOC112638496 [Camponotus floridanus]